MAAGAIKLAAQNRRARHDYQIEETLEAGIVLTGPEVKSLRAGKASIKEAHAAERDGEFWLMNAHISDYKPAARENHNPTRPRKLLLHRREVQSLMGKVRQEGMTLVPISLYFNERGIAKVQLGLARGKRKADKRESEKARDWQRQKARLLRERG
jgi:SsrA-binding protein